MTLLTLLPTTAFLSSQARRAQKFMEAVYRLLSAHSPIMRLTLVHYGPTILQNHISCFVRTWLSFVDVYKAPAGNIKRRLMVGMQVVVI
jgi:hypothetical protein